MGAAPNGRRRALRRGVFTLIIVGTCAIIWALTLAAQSVRRTSDGVDRLPYQVTGLANTHREALKMEVASQGDSAAHTAEVQKRRALMAQQVRLASTKEDIEPNPDRPAFDAQLAEVDRLLVANAGEPPSRELREAIQRLEVAAKHVFDTAELRYIDRTTSVLAESRRSISLLVGLAAVIAALGVGLIVVLQRSAGLDLRQKANELAWALTSLEVAQADRARLLEETVRATEGERTRLAAELHDGPIQALAALCYSLDRSHRRLARGDADTAAVLVAEARRGLGEEVGNLRRLMSELRPPVLDQGGIGDAVHDYVHAFGARTGMDFTVTADIPRGAVSADAETVVYRLMQESLTNVSRHARAGRVDVSVRRVEGTHVELVVTDDGEGFDMATSPDLVRNGHFGLAGMRERVDMAGGTFTVTSSPGSGTSIAATLPITQRELSDACADRP